MLALSHATGDNTLPATPVTRLSAAAFAPGGGHVPAAGAGGAPAVPGRYRDTQSPKTAAVSRCGVLPPRPQSPMLNIVKEFSSVAAFSSTAATASEDGEGAAGGEGEGAAGEEEGAAVVEPLAVGEATELADAVPAAVFVTVAAVDALPDADAAAVALKVALRIGVATALVDGVDDARNVTLPDKPPDAGVPAPLPSSPPTEPSEPAPDARADEAPEGAADRLASPALRPATSTTITAAAATSSRRGLVQNDPTLLPPLAVGQTVPFEPVKDAAFIGRILLFAGIPAVLLFGELFKACAANLTGGAAKTGGDAASTSAFT